MTCRTAPRHPTLPVPQLPAPHHSIRPSCCALHLVPQAKVQLQRELEAAEQREDAQRRNSSASRDAEALRLAQEQAETADFEKQRSQQQYRELEQSHEELRAQLTHEKDVHDRIQVRSCARPVACNTRCLKHVTEL